VSQDIDWSRPWYVPWAATGRPVAAAIDQGRQPHQALNDAGSPVLGVAHDALPAGMPYEQFIFETGCCPVREGLHDFFNGLCWIALPRTKRALNALQAAEITRQGGVGGRRGPVRDAITVFDENGLLLDAPQPLWDALLARDWHRLFVGLRPLWAQARILVVGHALLEQLAAPRKDITAHVWAACAPLRSSATADAWLAARCTPERLASKPFTPLPVLGIPGWCPENENFSFYDDSVVFRPRTSEGTMRPGSSNNERA
jgi:hypothetical protein